MKFNAKNFVKFVREELPNGLNIKVTRNHVPNSYYPEKYECEVSYPDSPRKKHSTFTYLEMNGKSYNFDMFRCDEEACHYLGQYLEETE